MHYCTAVAVLLDPNANTTNAIIARNYKGHGGPFWPLMTVVPAKWRRDQAYFGYPQAHKDDAERAARAGLELVAKIGQLLLPSGEPLQVRVGIATGLVVEVARRQQAKSFKLRAATRIACLWRDRGKRRAYNPVRAVGSLSKEAGLVFSPMDQDYAFGEMEDVGNSKSRVICHAPNTAHHTVFMPMEERVYFKRI